MSKRRWEKVAEREREEVTLWEESFYIFIGKVLVLVLGEILQ